MSRRFEEGNGASELGLCLPNLSLLNNKECSDNRAIGGLIRAFCLAKITAPAVLPFPRCIEIPPKAEFNFAGRGQNRALSNEIASLPA